MSCPFCKSDEISTRAVHGHTDHTCGGCHRSYRDGQRYAKRLTVICDDCGPVEVWPRVRASSIDLYHGTVEIEICVMCPECGKGLFAGEVEARSWHDVEVIQAVENGDGDNGPIHDPNGILSSWAYVVRDNASLSAWTHIIHKDASEFWSEMEDWTKRTRAALSFNPIERLTK